jgi:tetratricopeptide (TPR) repeat protein
VLKEYPDQDWLRLMIGDLYSDLGEYRKALSYYFNIRSPKELNVGPRQLDLRIGGIYEDLGKRDSALFYYDKILRTEPRISKYIDYDNEKVSVFIRLGEMAYSDSNYTEAIKYFSRSIELKRIPKALYMRANAFYLVGKPELARKDYDESIVMIRKIYINEHPKYNKILCDTCGTFFGEEEYMAVLEEWRNLDEKIEKNNRTDSVLHSLKEFGLMVDSVPKWNNEIKRLSGESDPGSIAKRKALEDSVEKYTDTTVTLNIYD